MGMAEKCSQNCLIIADRGVMDASAFISREAWDKILTKLSLEDIEISDNRYNHVVHLQSAAIGAEKFYTIEDHSARFEGIELARDRDRKAMEAWRDHPYVDIIDNRSDFDSKINRLIDLVVKRIGIDVGDRFRPNSRKVKFVVSGMCPDSAFPVKFTDFQVVHHYLHSAKKRFPIEAEEESQERQSHLHLHCPQTRAPGPSCRGQAANLPEGLHQPSLSQG